MAFGLNAMNGSMTIIGYAMDVARKALIAIMAITLPIPPPTAVFLFGTAASGW